jgi:flagellar motility protein MotE (MotC chaperone)
MPAASLSQGRTTPSFGASILLSVAVLLVRPAVAQDGRAPESQKSKATADKAADIDAQVKQRIVDLEKAEASVQEWVAKRDAILKAASDNLVAIYAKMQPETAATQIAAMDDSMAAAILGKLKPGAAGAILNEMEAERASRLAAFLSGAASAEKKS